MAGGAEQGEQARSSVEQGPFPARKPCSTDSIQHQVCVRDAEGSGWGELEQAAGAVVVRWAKRPVINVETGFSGGRAQGRGACPWGSTQQDGG